MVKSSPINGDNQDDESHKSSAEKPNLKGDRLNFSLLMILYIIQGFPIGLSSALPVILQSNPMITFADQAAFSITLWPYSVKLLWAPIVDALYAQLVGRRKSWLLPLQFLMGSCLIYLANNIDNWLPESGKPNITMLVFMVFAINLLSATQDIVVDGWSLTIMKKKNVGYASTSNSAGLPIGMFIGSVCFTLLVSEQFGKKYFKIESDKGGLVTMKSFLNVWGIIVLLTTSLVGLFKKEKDNRHEDDYVKINVFQNYKMLWDVLKLHRIQVLAVALLTTKIGFIAMDVVSNLKLIDAGVTKDEIMIFTTVMYGIKFIMPIFVSKYITGPKPMSYYLKMTPLRLLWGLTYVALVYYTPSIIHKDGIFDVPMYYYYIILGLVMSISEMMNTFMVLSLNAFYCRISDPRFGGTFMTLFNSFYFFGFLISNTIILKLVSITTLKICSNDDQNNCATSDLQKLCKNNGGSCTIYADGYYIAMVVCVIIGLAWYFIFKNIIHKYQSLSLSYWSVKVNHSETEEVDEPCIISSE